MFTLHKKQTTKKPISLMSVQPFLVHLLFFSVAFILGIHGNVECFAIFVFYYSNKLARNHLTATMFYKPFHSTFSIYVYYYIRSV